eukprot:2979964-Pyramimonas_sp.AAC.1
MGTLSASGWAQLYAWGGPKIPLVQHTCAAALSRAATITFSEHTHIRSNITNTTLSWNDDLLQG